MIRFTVEDGSALPFNACGGVGCISVTANVAPALCAQLQEATLRGDFKAANAINDKLAPLHRALFLETSPAPVKYAVSLLNRASGELRLPMVEVTAETKQAVRDAMAHAELI